SRFVHALIWGDLEDGHGYSSVRKESCTLSTSAPEPGQSSASLPRQRAQVFFGGRDEGSTRHTNLSTMNCRTPVTIGSRKSSVRELVIITTEPARIVCCFHAGLLFCRPLGTPTGGLGFRFGKRTVSDLPGVHERRRLRRGLR